MVTISIQDHALAVLQVSASAPSAQLLALALCVKMVTFWILQLHVSVVVLCLVVFPASTQPTALSAQAGTTSMRVLAVLVQVVVQLVCQHPTALSVPLRPIFQELTVYLVRMF